MSSSLAAHLLFLLPVVEAASGGAAWYTHEYEYNYVEALILICLVIIALVWEHLWHHLKKMSEFSYRYGELHKLVSVHKGRHMHVIEEGAIRHLRLYEELMNRAGGEFMTLGVLAFITFMCNNSGFFEAISNLSDNEHGFPLPKTQVDWLHMVEMVHVKLFAAMMLYFVLMTFIVMSSLKQIQKWESCRLRWLKHKSHDNNGLSWNVTRVHQEVDYELSRYLLWREYFIEVMMSWRKRRPRVWRETLDMFEIDPQEEGASTKLRTIVERRFALSAYLSLNVVESVCDDINVHKSTWVSLLVVLAIFAVVHRFLKTGLLAFVWVFLGIIIIIMLGMTLGVRRRIGKIAKFMVQARRTREEKLSMGTSIPGGNQSEIIRCNSPESTITCDEDDSEDGHTKRQSYVSRRIQSFHHKFPTELLIMRILQILLFLMSYIFARTIIDFHGWRDELQQQALLSCVFTIIFFVLAWWLRNWVPTFIALMALPPYVTKANLQLFWAVLANDDDNLVPCLRSVGLGQDTPQPTPKASPMAPQTSLGTIISEGSRSGLTSNVNRFGMEASDLSAVWAEVGRLRHRLEAVEPECRTLEEGGRFVRDLAPESMGGAKYVYI